MKFSDKIFGQESRPCSQEGCDWRDNGDNRIRYGVYIGGKYYCKKHGEEEWEKLSSN